MRQSEQQRALKVLGMFDGDELARALLVDLVEVMARGNRARRSRRRRRAAK